MLNFLKTLPQYLVPQKLLSSILGKLASQGFAHQTVIKWFVKHYQVDMSQAKESDIKHYKSFNDFFIRELKEDARPFDDADNIMVSPVDGKVSQIGKTTAGRIIQAKGRDYSVTELLGGNLTTCDDFMEGKFTTLYLSPRDYHRIHMPIDGTLKEMTYIPGDLFAVKPVTAETVPNLFARNERLVIIFETELGPLALVMVGAMIVGNMSTVWSGELPRSKEVRHWKYPNVKFQNITFKKGQEIGHFKLGSTVILLTSNQATNFNWDDNLNANSPIQLGQSIGML